MTPQQCKAARRLGWPPILGALTMALFLIIVPSVWYVNVPVAFVIGMIGAACEPALYRWVTAPEREEIVLDVLANRRIKTGWFKSRPITRAEAERLVDETDIEGLMDSDWRLALWRNTRAGNKTLAEQPISAAHLSQDGCVWLNLAEAHCMASWLPKP